MPLGKVVVPHIRRFCQRTTIVVIAIFFTACATDPRSLCESLVPSSWTYLPQGASRLSRARIVIADDAVPDKRGEACLSRSSALVRTWR